MISYGNTHFALETLRQDASLQKTLGPRILIVGPENAGKTSLVKILAAYAYRSGGTPVVANLDPKEGFLTIPGTISASALESIIDITEGWGSSPINGPSQIPVKLPLVYQYGLEDPDTKSDHFKAIIRRLALSVTSRLEDDETAKSTGCIIDTAGSLSSSGKANYDLIQHIISEFQINVLITLGSERLHNDMSRRFSSPRISILKLDKSGGCVDRDAAYMHHLRNHQIRTYFFGNLRAMLSPHSHQIPFDEILIYRTTTTTSTTTAYPTDSPTSSTSSSITTTTTTPYDENPLLPSTTTTSSSPTQTLERLPQPSTMMLNAVLAIVQADINDAPDIVREASVIGFVFVSEVDDKRRKIRVLAPMTGRLPRRVLVWSSFPEAVGDLLG